MANISKMKLPNNTTYNLKDANAGYSIEIVNGVLGLKNAAGTVISSANLPAGGANFALYKEQIYAFNSDGTNTIKDKNTNKVVAFLPTVYNLVDATNINKVYAKFIYYSASNTTLTLVKKYSTSYRGAINTDFKIIPITSNTSSEITNFISDLPTKYGNSLGQYNGCRFDYSLNPAVTPERYKAIWEASNNGTLIATGFAFDDQPLSYGIPFRAIRSDSFGASTVITARQNYNELNVGLLRDIIWYGPNTYTGNVVYINNASITWDGQHNNAIISGIVNGQSFEISRVNNDGTVGSVVSRASISGGGFMLRTTACASNETTVVKVKIYATYGVASHGDLEFYMSLPAGKTVYQKVT